METRHCPNCKSVQPVYAMTRGGVAQLRCRTCGFPVDQGLPAAPPVAKDKGKVLCIDDDPIIQKILGTTLQKAGFAPLIASDGVSGIETVRRERPILVLLDIQMPGIDGFEVCRQLRAEDPAHRMPIIILTSLPDANLNVQAFKAGADLALTKPFHADRLMATVSAALALKR